MEEQGRVELMNPHIQGMEVKYKNIKIQEYNFNIKTIFNEHIQYYIQHTKHGGEAQNTEI